MDYAQVKTWHKIALALVVLYLLTRKAVPLTEQSQHWALTGGRETVLPNYSGL